MNVTAVDLKNAFLATPITKEGKLYMGKAFYNQQTTIEDFLDQCYVEPDFVTQDSMVAKVNSEAGYSLDKNQDYDFFLSPNNFASSYKYEINRRCSNFQKEEFEKSLLGSDGEDDTRRLYGTIFLIEGPAGSGKTTYAHKILTNKFNVDYFDFETATQKSCWFFNDFYDFDPHSFDPIDAFEMLLLSCIHIKVARTNDESENDYRNRLSNLCDTYNEYFISKLIIITDTPQYRQFFNILKAYLNKEYDYSEMTKCLHSHIKHNIEDHDHETENDEILGIKFLLGLTMRIYFCQARMSGQKTILFLDNIERYIVSQIGQPYINIYDIDLQRIINSIYSITDETEDLVLKIYDKLSGSGYEKAYETSFGVLITLRESTINLVKKNSAFRAYFEKHHAEHMPTYVNITNWFDYKQILNKKTKYFLGSSMDSDLKDNPIACAFENIMNDISKSKWCLRNLFMNMFNDNFRRFAANLTEAFFYYEEALIFFNDMWKVALESKRYLKHLCRKLVLRLVLDYMQNDKSGLGNDGFFDILMARTVINPLPEQIQKSSYARRILTYLDNMEKNPNYESTVSFPILIKALLHKPIHRFDKNVRRSNVCINDPRIGDIANILSTASETAKINTNGVELLSLNVDIDEMGNNTLADEMKAQWSKYLIENINGKQNFNIKITPAGSVLALIFPCFEYFVCRYQPNSIPLLMIKSEEDRKKLLFGYDDTDKQGKPVKVLGIVERAMICIDAVVKFESKLLCMGKNEKKSIPKWLYKYSYAEKGTVHPIRIICEHLGYLQDYKFFLLEYADESYETGIYKQSSADDIGIIDQAIMQYKQKLKEVITKHPYYAEVGEIPHNDFFDK